MKNPRRVWRCLAACAGVIVASLGAPSGCAEQPAEPAPKRATLLAGPVIAPNLGAGARHASPASGAPAIAPTSATGADFVAARREALEASVASAQRVFDANPTDEDAAIWLGRRIAYTGRSDDAIRVFTDALAIHPSSYRLLRHRGHRYLTIRRFDEAIDDLTLAARLAGEASLDRALALGGSPGGAGAGISDGAGAIDVPWDEVEPDGAPNSLGVPRSAARFNILYHLGLALHLRGAPGDLERAAEVYARCADYSRRNDDMTVATANWRYLTLRLLRREDEAKAALAPITASMNCLEDGDYLTLCLLHKGAITPDQALAHAGAPGSNSAETIGFGVGMFHALGGKEGARGKDEARRAFRAILDAPESARASFGFIAAEQALLRMRVE